MKKKAACSSMFLLLFVTSRNQSTPSSPHAQCHATNLLTNIEDHKCTFHVRKRIFLSVYKSFSPFHTKTLKTCNETSEIMLCPMMCCQRLQKAFFKHIPLDSLLFQCPVSSMPCTRNRPKRIFKKYQFSIVNAIGTI